MAPDNAPILGWLSLSQHGGAVHSIPAESMSNFAN
jgi:hypothetical protein